MKTEPIENTVEPTLSVAHEALFRVWDTLGGWLRQDRKALALRSQIEDAAAEWQAENRSVSRTWPEERILDAVRAIEKSGVSLPDVKDRATVDAFLGPADSKEIEALLALSAEEDGTKGSGRYGDAWRLPLGHNARASAGVRLALLGDPRPGVRLRGDGLPDIDWRRIDGGDVTIEVLALDDPNSKVSKYLPCFVSPFWMARYPITIALFRAFVDECYRDDGWHVPPGPPGFTIDLPADYLPPQHVARYDNHPADRVNWLDCMAFCHWLSARLHFEVRLPTEFEWQRAATDDDPMRTYPWGLGWDPPREQWRANTFEGRLGRSTAVGMYPAGASAAEVLDMAGTLWEWCLNEFDDPYKTVFPRSKEDQGALGDAQNRNYDVGFRVRYLEEQRALRGGSWDNELEFARSHTRMRNYLQNRNNNVGFRVMCSSPSSGIER